LQVKQLDAEHWLLEVTNPGVLPPADVTHPSAATDNTGTGLKNLRHRLQLIYRNSASLQLLQDGPLVRAQLILPQQSASSLQPPSQESS
jgi:LytS/YehU family sensor histidine kinase